MSKMSSDLDTAPVVSATVSHRLYQVGVGALVAALVYCYWSTHGDISLAQFLALLVIVVSSLPALQWAKSRRTWFPAFEISMLTCIAFYAAPLFQGAEDLAVYDAGVQTKATLLVLIYVVAALLGFGAVRLHRNAPRWASETLLPPTAMTWVPVGMFLNVVFVYVSIYLDIIPADLIGTLRALFFGVGIMATFILARLWGLGMLQRPQIAFFVATAAVYLVLTFSSLYLIGGISLLALAFISYASARRRVPLIPMILCVSVVALLHLGKPEMRKKYWDPETNQSVGAPVKSLLDLPAYYSEWFGYSFEAMNAHGRDSTKTPSTLFDRASLIQMICLSVSEVPDSRPYLMGESYIDIPALFIPRFLWQDKPSSLLANIRLAVYFNLVSPDSAFSVSIAFGPLAEAYINFGFFGVGLLGFIMGVFYKRISMLSDGAPQFSALGIFMILLTAWSFQAEQVMATWISSLFQAGVVCVGLPIAYRKLFAA